MLPKIQTLGSNSGTPTCKKITWPMGLPPQLYEHVFKQQAGICSCRMSYTCVASMDACAFVCAISCQSSTHFFAMKICSTISGLWGSPGLSLILLCHSGVSSWFLCFLCRNSIYWLLLPQHKAGIFLTVENHIFRGCCPFALFSSDLSYSVLKLISLVYLFIFHIYCIFLQTSRRLPLKIPFWAMKPI